LVEEKDLIIPNMRGIMSARTKPLQVVEPTSSEVKVEAVFLTVFLQELL
jgi:electron transfer flavoprotein beta subunit